MTPKKFAVGVVLTLVMIVVLLVNAWLFSARDFQFGLAQVAPATNGVISVSRLLEVDEQIEQLRAETAEPRGALLEIDRQVAEVDNDIATEEGRANEARAAITLGVASVEENAGVATAASAAAALDVSALSARVLSLAGRSGLAPGDQQTVATLRGQVDQLAAQEARLVELDAARRDLVVQQRALGAQVAESDRRIFALQQSVVPNYEYYDRVRGEVLALKHVSPLGLGVSLVQSHPAFISTILVMLMGALGAILYLFPAYLNRPEPVTFAEIIVRIIFGACAALAFYMIANATIFGFSVQPGVEQASTSTGLNPFTVALIGIIAGVLAEDIAKWIQDRGKGIFTQGVQSPTRDTVAAPAQADDPAFTGVNPHGGPNAP